MLLTIISFIVVISAVVIPHELGHLAFALIAGIKPLEFGVGFPPRLLAFRKWGMLISLNMIPVGGFVRVAGMNPEAEAEDEKYSAEESYAAKPLFSRALVILSGPMMNFVFAFLLLSFIFAAFGAPSGMKVEKVLPGSEAERVGLAAGDEIVAIDGRAVERREQAIQTIHSSAGKALSLAVYRGGKMLSIAAVPRLDPELKVGLIGFVPGQLYQRKPLYKAVWMGARQTAETIAALLGVLGGLIIGRISIMNLVGPLGIAVISGQQASSGGLVELLYLTAFISINLGLINLLPLPALDGGRLVFMGVEAVRGKPMPREMENRMHLVGIILLLALIAVITANDAIRIFGWFPAR